MKNKSLLFVIVISLMVLPNLSFAVTSSTKDTIKAEIEAKKEALKTAVTESRQNVTDKIKERVDQFVSNIIERFDAATSRLEIIADRIDSRMAKIEAGNIDVAKSKDLMVIARAKIATAKTSVGLISTSTSVSSDNAPVTVASIKKDFEAIKTQIEKAKEDIKAAHAALVDVVESLKPGDNKLKVNQN